MTKVSKKAIAVNSGFLYIRMGVTMIITLYTTRIVLSYLGEVNFGIYGIIWSLVSIFSFINLSINTASRRCLSFELGKGNQNNYPKVFGTLIKYSIVASILIYGVQELIGSYLINNKLNLPIGRESDIMNVYHVLCLVFVFNVIQIPFISSLISQEKIKIYSYISIIDSILKLLLVFILSIVSFDVLMAYALLLLIEQIIIFCFYLYFAIRNSKVNFKKDSLISKEINKYLIWNTLGGLASVGLNQGVQLLINLFFSPVVNAAQTISSQVRNATETFTSSIRVSFNPPLIKSCAEGNNKQIEELLSFSTRFSSIAVLLITVPLISKLQYILNLWLVNPPQYTYILCLLFLINSIIDNASTPIVSIIQATGDIKRYQIITSVLLLLIIPLTYFSYQNGSSPQIYGYYFIIISIIILFIRIAFLKLITDISIIKTLKLISNQVIILPLLAIIIPLSLASIMDDNIPNLILIFIISILIVLILSWFIIIKPNERGSIIQFIKKYKLGV